MEQIDAINALRHYKRAQIRDEQAFELHRVAEGICLLCPEFDDMGTYMGCRRFADFNKVDDCIDESHKELTHAEANLRRQGKEEWELFNKLLKKVML